MFLRNILSSHVSSLLPKSAHNLSHLLPQCIPDGFGLLFIYLFFAFDCSLEILERKDCLYLEEKWVGDGPKNYIWRENGKMGIKFIFLYVLLFCFFFFFVERKDCLYLEGKWVRENQNKQKHLT